MSLSPWGIYCSTMATLDELLRDERLKPFLPLLYTAWSDGSLTPDELNELRSVLCEVVDGEASPIIERWLDPERPPTGSELDRLGGAIRRGLTQEELHLGPVELGLRLVGSVPDSVVTALRAADRAVGPFGPGATRDLQVSRASTLQPLPVLPRASFDRSELKALLDGPRGVVKRQVRQILSQPAFRLRHGLPIDEHRRQVSEWLEVLAAEGIGALGYPETVGGGGDPAGFLAAFATIAHHDLSLLTKFGVQFGLYAGALMRLGTETHRDLLRRAITGEEPGCFAMTETGHGSNVADLRTVATFSEDGFEIHTPDAEARKDYIGNAAVDGRRAVVFARLVADETDHGVHAFVVPIRGEDGRPLPGVTIGDDGPKAGLNGVDNGWLMFDRVRVPRQALLDRYASVDEDGTYSSPITSPARRFFTTLGTLVGGRVSVAMASASVAETALAIAVRYAHRRRQFSDDGGREILLIDYRSHQRRLMPRLAATVAYHFATARLAADYVALESEPGDTGPERRILEGRAAGLKAQASWHALDTVAECRQACGGQGYMAENRLGPLMSDVDVFTTFEGDNTVLAQLHAKALLTGHRSSVDDLTPGRMVRLIIDRVGDFVTESVPVVGAVGGDFDDPVTCSSLLTRRSRHLLATLAARMRARIDDGMEASAALLDVQAHALAVSRAAVEAEVLEGILEVEAEDSGLGEMLERLAVLYALSRVEADMAGYLTTGLVTSNGASQIRDLVTDLCAEVAAESLHLVDSFGIPDQVLSAPIAVAHTMA